MNDYVHIEEQIAELQKEGISQFYYTEDAELMQRAKDTMQSLLDVATLVSSRSHACGGRDCVGLYGIETGSLHKCQICREMAEALAKLRSE